MTNLGGFNAELPDAADDLRNLRGGTVDLHPMAHVVDAVHFLPSGAAGSLDRAENGRDRHQGVFDVMDVATEMKAFGLSSARAMNKPADGTWIISQKCRDDRSVASRRAQERLADGHGGILQGILEPVGPAIHQILVDLFVEGFGIVSPVIGAQQVMPCAGQAVAADAAVRHGFVGGLSVGSQSDDGQSGFDPAAGDHFLFVQDGRGAAVDDNGRGQVSDIGSFAAAAMNVDPMATQYFQDLLVSADELRQDVPRDSFGISIDGARNQNATGRAHTQKIVQIHDDAVLRNSAKDGGVSGLTVVQVGQNGFRATSVGVDQIA